MWCTARTSSCRKIRSGPPDWCASTCPAEHGSSLQGGSLQSGARPFVVELAHGVAPDLVREHEATRTLVTREARTHPVAQSVGVGWVVAAGGDGGRDDLAPLVVGYTHDDGVGHPRVFLQHLFHLLGPDLLAARVDAVRAAPEQGQGAVDVDGGEVA